MKKFFLCILAFILLCGCQSFDGIQRKHAQTGNDIRVVNFAERSVMLSFAVNLSPSFRNERGGNTGSMIELGIGLLGTSRNDVADKALVNLLGAKFDAGISEERGCQIVERGTALLGLLKSMKSESIAKHCTEMFYELKKHELSEISDIYVNDVCHTPAEIEISRREYLEAIEAGRQCPF